MAVQFPEAQGHVGVQSKAAEAKIEPTIGSSKERSLIGLYSDTDMLEPTIGNVSTINTSKYYPKNYSELEK